MNQPDDQHSDQDEFSCIQCGGKAVRQAHPKGISAWKCLGCGVEYLDGGAAALNNAVYHSNEVRLYTNGKEICAMIGPDPVQGIAGYGPSVHDALHDLADQLVKCGVWIEVTDPNHPFTGPWTDSKS